MSSFAETVTPSRPLAPTTLESSGLTIDLVSDLVLKTLHRTSELSGGEIARRLGLLYAVVAPSLDSLKAQRFCEIAGGPSLGGPSFRYRLTDAGHRRAAVAFDANEYVGVAPVSVPQYRQYTDEFRRTISRTVSAEQVRAAFSHLMVSDRVLDEIGPAVNSGHSIFMYGPPGNGKTVMSRAIRKLLTGTIAIPHAIEYAGQIIRFFDTSLHEPVPSRDADRDDMQYDRRWIECLRPMVSVGGELTLDALSLVHNPHSGTYRAPVQTLANGGVLLVDEFGRQRCHPRDLLNWWMVPLESGYETLSLQSGEKIEMPFFPLVIFSTNLRPSELVDEAFLRRIQYKIYAESPTPADFVRIFEIACDERGIPFEPSIVEHLLEHFYRQHKIELRGCQPRDLINQALALASYRGEPRRLTATLLDEACHSYFIDDHESKS
jgi:DNA-binding MarR family transcriptional regulator